jgi:hypothetical protein
MTSTTLPNATINAITAVSKDKKHCRVAVSKETFNLIRGAKPAIPFKVYSDDPSDPLSEPRGRVFEFNNCRLFTMYKSYEKKLIVGGFYDELKRLI